MRTRGSMGKMVNKLTKREKTQAFSMIDRIARGVSHPYTREFMPAVVASNVAEPAQQTMQASPVRESAFVVREQTADNVVVMRSEPKVASNAKPKMVFPDVFYEYFEVVEHQPKKVG